MRKTLLPIGITFVILNGLFLVFRKSLEKNGFNWEVLTTANLILFGMTIVAALIQLRGLRSPNPQAFIRGVTGSLIVKMFVCMIAVFVYAWLNKENINKPAIFASMGLYIVYTVIEVASLMKAAKTNGR